MAQSEDERYIVELKEYLKDYYSGRDKEVAKNRLAREGSDFTVADVPEAYRSTAQIVTLPRVPDTLQRMQAIVTDDDAAWEVPPIDETDAHKRNASQKERWLGASFERMTEESGRDAVRMACDAALADGLGVLQLTYLPDVWGEEPQRSYEIEEEDQTAEPDENGKRPLRKVTKDKDAKQYLSEVKAFRQSAAFPFWLEDVDVLCYYPLRDGRGVSEVLKVSERSILPAMQALRVKGSYEGEKRRYKQLRKGESFPVNGGLRGGSREMIECVERWTKSEVTYYLENQKLYTVKHNYGFINFAEIAGYTTSSRDPAKAYRSVIASQRELVKELRRVLTIWLNWAYMAGWPYMEEGEDTGKGRAIPDGVSNVTQLQAGAILRRGTRFIEPPTAGRDLAALAQIFQAEADRSGLASVMYGSGTGVSSGYMAASLQAAAQSILKPIIRNAGLGLARIGRMMLELIDRRIQDTVYVWGAAETQGSREWLGLGPKDIKGYYPVKARLQPLMPLDEVVQRDSALRMYQGGLWDPETALQHTGENQPERILDRVWAYSYLKESGLDKRIGERAARAVGLIEEPQINVSESQMPGVGGAGMPAIGPIEPQVPGVNLPLVPPGGQDIGGANMPLVMRRPGIAQPMPQEAP